MLNLDRARRAGLPATLTVREWLTTITGFEGLCAYCGVAPFTVLDHVKPLAAGGGTTKDNCVPACALCNLIKNDAYSDITDGLLPAETLDRIRGYLGSARGRHQRRTAIREGKVARRKLMVVEQSTVELHGKSLVLLRLWDGQPATVLRWLCESLELSSPSQIRRIRRTPAVAKDLVEVPVWTGGGGTQLMAALLLRAVPFWLAGIDVNRVRDDLHGEVLRYQREVVDVLYRHFYGHTEVHGPPIQQMLVDGA